MGYLTNLLQETKEKMESINKKVEDIIFIGTAGRTLECTWEEYKTMADRDYDGGYGGNEVRGDLIIVFKDNGVMSRWEYDGSEGWEYRAAFKQPKESNKLTDLFC